MQLGCDDASLRKLKDCDYFIIIGFKRTEIYLLHLSTESKVTLITSSHPDQPTPSALLFKPDPSSKVQPAATSILHLHPPFSQPRG
jgi:molybdopterin-guanine dinucleotide biosynthesis protein